MDEEAQEVVIYWKGTVPSHVQEMISAMRSWHGQASVSVEGADFSEAELNAEAQRISAIQDASTGRAYGPLVHSEDDASGLVVEVELGSALLEDSSSQLQRRFATDMPERAVAREGVSEGLDRMVGDTDDDAQEGAMHQTLDLATMLEMRVSSRGVPRSAAGS